jgi:hypothetical protein
MPKTPRASPARARLDGAIANHFNRIESNTSTSNTTIRFLVALGTHSRTRVTEDWARATRRS